jgi:hypothetical protein
MHDCEALLVTPGPSDSSTGRVFPRADRLDGRTVGAYRCSSGIAQRQSTGPSFALAGGRRFKSSTHCWPGTRPTPETYKHLNSVEPVPATRANRADILQPAK